MSFKDFSTAQSAPANAKVEDKAKKEPSSDQPAVQSSEAPAKVAPEPKS